VSIATTARLRDGNLERGVHGSVVRCEDRSANTWQNVEFALPHLRAALDQGLPITAVCKWYHRRAIHCLRTLLPEAEVIYAVTFEPIYSGVPITRQNWMARPGGRRRVLREWQEVQRRVSDGSYQDLTRTDTGWRGPTPNRQLDNQVAGLAEASA
jgi:uncharacterized SAM-binding protein YcdF (DUF218 family)